MIARDLTRLRTLAAQIDQCQHLALTAPVDDVCDLMHRLDDVLADKLIAFTDIYQNDPTNDAALKVAVGDVMSRASALAILKLGMRHRLQVRIVTT